MKLNDKEELKGTYYYTKDEKSWSTWDAPTLDFKSNYHYEEEETLSNDLEFLEDNGKDNEFEFINK